jgi:transposase-like protein
MLASVNDLRLGGVQRRNSRPRPKTDLYVSCFYEKGMKISAIARMFGVSLNVVLVKVKNYDPALYFAEKALRKTKKVI